ncbi:hypothetical protein Peur_057991 [Populus x canadensis]
MLVAAISSDNNGSCCVQPHEATIWCCISSSVSQTGVALQSDLVVHATQASRTSDARATSIRVPSPCSCKGQKISSAFLIALVPNL